MARVKKGPNKRPPKLGSVEKIKTGTKTYVKLLSTDSIEKFNEVGELVNKKKLKWAYYVIENKIGVHYYLILKKRK